MQQESAEAIALKALAWIASDEELLGVFMGATGASPEDLKARLNEPEFLVSILEFLTMDDAWVVRFCDTHRLNYEAPLEAKQSLPGGGQVHWT
ncbi:DUF3572 domain-containing protein [Tropicimonas sp. S265A]|uniref:DUF3572 domain-containing protein n=1 Tax=Tropicimonas sp. S265A TaxID=3415134 RepID=UPI003C7E88AE